MCCAVMFCTSGLSAQQTLRLTQTECREMALANNEKLKQSDNALHQAELDRQIAKTSFLPSFDGSATGIYGVPDTEIGETMKLQMRGTYMAGINLVQPLYTGGKLLAGKRLAEIAKETATEQNRMTRMDVLVEADNAYWTYIAVRQKVKMMSSYHRQMDTLYNPCSGRHRYGNRKRPAPYRSEAHGNPLPDAESGKWCRLVPLVALSSHWSRFLHADRSGGYSIDSFRT